MSKEFKPSKHQKGQVKRPTTSDQVPENREQRKENNKLGQQHNGAEGGERGQ